MRIIALLLRSRQAWQAPVGVALVALLGTLLTRRYDGQWLAQAAALVLCPMVAGCLIGAGAESPFGESEETAALPLPVLRFGLLIGTLLLAAACLLGANALVPWVSDPVAEPDLWIATSAAEVTSALLRNLFALSGVALIGARLLGAGLSWGLPLFFGLLSLVARMMADTGAPGEPAVPDWVLPVQKAGYDAAFLVGVGLLVVGVVSVVIFGAKDARDQDPA